MGGDPRDEDARSLCFGGGVRIPPRESSGGCSRPRSRTSPKGFLAAEISASAKTSATRVHPLRGFGQRGGEAGTCRCVRAAAAVLPSREFGQPSTTGNAARSAPRRDGICFGGSRLSARRTSGNPGSWPRGACSTWPRADGPHSFGRVNRPPDAQPSDFCARDLASAGSPRWRRPGIR
jgi:hypothetical protein